MGSFNNRNIAPKIIYSSLTCRFFSRLNQNIIFLAITLLCSLTLILPLSSTLYLLVCSDVFFILIVIIFIQFIRVHVLQIRQSGDMEMNPGPKTNPCHIFSICHWNLNSSNAHNYLKVILLRAYVAIKKFVVVCLSEISICLTYLIMTV